GFPADCSFGIPASSFPRSGASGISRAVHTFKTPTLSRHRADGSTCSASDIAVSQYARHDQRNLDR
ncbi:hypothetical protein, partial [Mycobacteroides abscessus]|uniref:hypothetical protein n=1 Tax=Mycobacteroides abscessus TaxID=36809 RepID=UPI0010556EA9